jgi:CheY-like chemotaxis protein
MPAVLVLEDDPRPRPLDGFHVHPAAVEVAQVPCGFETIATIRADPRSASIPIVMFSRNERGLHQKALAHGADAFVAKGSLDWAELMDEVRRFMAPNPGPR